MLNFLFAIVAGEVQLLPKMDMMKNNFYCLVYFVESECTRVIKVTDVKEFLSSLLTDVVPTFDYDKQTVYHTFRTLDEDEQCIQVLEVGSE